jgi:Zn finger protein HypA/HybF involved in hydrogenase expression
MHETGLFKNILRFLDEEEKCSCKRIKKVYIALSEFGGISEEHLREHFKEESYATKWEGLEIEVEKIPFGPELEIKRLDFE